MLHGTTSGRTMDDKGLRTTHHRVKRNEFRLGNGVSVSIEYWINQAEVGVAAFDVDGHQASMATYHAHVDDVEHFDAATREALIDSLSNTLEYDLINKPELCLKKHLASLNA